MRPPLRKRLGQHHLRDGSLCRPLIDYLDPSGRRVAEIGPGGGVLTAELLSAGARVTAVEIDLSWLFHLRRRRLPGLGLFACDARHLDWRRWPRPTLVTGNLPFNVATHLIQDLLPCHEIVPRAAFMVQKEVADRLVAGPGDRDYGALSVLVRAHAAARYLATVKPGSFRPPPRVAAAFVGLELEPPPLPAADMPAFRRFVHLAFGQRRKTLRNALASAWGRERATAVLAAAGFDPTCRAESLDVGALVEIFLSSGG